MSDTRTGSLRRVRRVLVLTAVAGMAVVLWSMFTAGAQLRESGERSVETGFPGLPVFTAERSGNTSTLQPRIGFLVVVLVVPLLAAGISYVLERRRNG
ncbi:MAG: hypothetical protein GEU78_15305 [Actinobacteria bacterium]|nr:hypothetical protein [Actinomycetota bacterium]